MIGWLTGLWWVVFAVALLVVLFVGLTLLAQAIEVGAHPVWPMVLTLALAVGMYMLIYQLDPAGPRASDLTAGQTEHLIGSHDVRDAYVGDGALFPRTGSGRWYVTDVLTAQQGPYLADLGRAGSTVYTNGKGLPQSVVASKP